MKTFLLFVALICATTMATPLPPTTASGEPLSAFLGSLKQALENLLAMVNRFENGQSTQIDQSTRHILVVTGYGDSMMQTQLWPKTDTQCALHDFPLEVKGTVGFWTAQGPTVCGGYGGENKCFLYREHQWMPWTNMGTVRRFASTLQINPNQALIIGGRDENGKDLKTTELISSSGSEEGKDFPVTITKHCSFAINSTHAMVTGGVQNGSTSANTWYVDLTTTLLREWESPVKPFTSGPTIKTKRMNHGCSIFQNGTKSFGIVAGGYAFPLGVSASTEMIDFNQESPRWTQGMQDKSPKSSSLTKVFFLLIFRT